MYNQAFRVEYFSRTRDGKKLVLESIVSFAAVIRVVTRHAMPLREERCVTSDNPNNGCEEDYESKALIYSLAYNF